MTAGKQLPNCMLASFRRRVNEISTLLGYSATCIGSQSPTLWHNLSVPSSTVKNSKFLDCLTLEDCSSRNVSISPPTYAAGQPKKLKISATDCSKYLSAFLSTARVSKTIVWNWCKHPLVTSRHGAEFQNISIFNNTAMNTSNPAAITTTLREAVRALLGASQSWSLNNYRSGK